MADTWRWVLRCSRRYATYDDDPSRDVRLVGLVVHVRVQRRENDVVAVAVAVAVASPRNLGLEVDHLHLTGPQSQPTQNPPSSLHLFISAFLHHPSPHSTPSGQPRRVAKTLPNTLPVTPHRVPQTRAALRPHRHARAGLRPARPGTQRGEWLVASGALLLLPPRLTAEMERAHHRNKVPKTLRD
jgi:hypothetical protein